MIAWRTPADGPILVARDLARYLRRVAAVAQPRARGPAAQILKAVDGVDFAIQRGETLSLVGESGCGKSTVARLIVGLYRPTRGAHRVRRHRPRVAQAAARSLQPIRRRFQMIFQDPYASLNPRWRVADIVAEPIRAHGLMRDRGEIRRRVDELLRLVGLAPADGEKYPARVLRRPAPAHLDRARAVEQAGVPRLRRADLGARRLGAGADPEPDEGPAARARPHLPLHLAQPRGGLHISDRVGVMYLGRLVELRRRDKLFAGRCIPTRACCSTRSPTSTMSGGRARRSRARCRTRSIRRPAAPSTRAARARTSAAARAAGVQADADRRRGRLPRGRGAPPARVPRGAAASVADLSPASPGCERPHKARRCAPKRAIAIVTPPP